MNTPTGANKTESLQAYTCINSIADYLKAACLAQFSQAMSSEISSEKCPLQQRRGLDLTTHTSTGCNNTRWLHCSFPMWQSLAFHSQLHLDLSVTW